MDSEPTVSRLRWLRDGDPKVPIDVAASGPKVIEIAARHADAITFAVGVDPYRLGWAVEHARAGARVGRARPRHARPRQLHPAVRARRPGDGAAHDQRQRRLVRPVLGDARHASPGRSPSRSATR